jgi:hypothetical protein
MSHSSIDPLTPGNAGQSSDPASLGGPSAHGDLTIAEQLETMRVAGEHRPGEECFLDAHSETHWVASGAVHNFMRKFGADHSSNYLTQHGATWEEDFFNQSDN